MYRPDIQHTSQESTREFSLFICGLGEADTNLGRAPVRLGPVADCTRQDFLLPLTSTFAHLPTSLPTPSRQCYSECLCTAIHSPNQTSTQRHLLLKGEPLDYKVHFALHLRVLSVEQLDHGSCSSSAQNLFVVVDPFHPVCCALPMSSSKSLSRFIVLVSLLCIICPHFIHDIVWSSKFLVPRVHVLVDFTIKTTSGSSDFCVGFVHILLHVVQQGTGLICSEVWLQVVVKFCPCGLCGPAVWLWVF